VELGPDKFRSLPHCYVGMVKLVPATAYADFTNDGTEKIVARSFMKQTGELTEMQIKKVIETIGRIIKTIS
jgi:hypothetical protein